MLGPVKPDETLTVKCVTAYGGVIETLKPRQLEKHLNKHRENRLLIWQCTIYVKNQTVIQYR